MQEPSVFTRIINGELPCHKVYEDDKTLAFLDIHPVQPGHTLVVPKVQVDRYENLPDDYSTALTATLKKVMKRLVEVLGADHRACVIIEGFEVPHVHLKVIPARDPAEFTRKPDLSAGPDHAALAAMANRLRF